MNMVIHLMDLGKRPVISFGKVGDTGSVSELFLWRVPKDEAQEMPSQLFDL